MMANFLFLIPLAVSSYYQHKRNKRNPEASRWPLAVTCFLTILVFGFYQAWKGGAL